MSADPAAPPARTRSEVLALGVLVLLGLGLRIRSIGVGDFWVDEAISWLVGSAPPSELAARIGDVEIKPPLYFWILHLWMRIIGDSEVAMRSLSLCFWPIFALLMEALGLRVCGRWGLLPVLLCALSPLLVHYDIEARPYAMLLTAETLFLLLALNADERGKTSDRVLLAGAGFLIMSIQLSGAFFILPVLIAILLPYRKDPRELARILVPHAVAGVAFAVMIAVTVPTLIRRTGSLEGHWWAASPSAVQVLSAPVRLLAPVVSWKTYLVLSRATNLLLLLSTALLTLLSGFGLVVLGRRKMLLWAGPGALLLIAAYSVLRANLLFERYYIGCAPVLYLGVTGAVAFLWERRRRMAQGLLPAVLAAQVSLCVLLPPSEGSTGYRRAVEAILAREAGSVAILSVGSDSPSVRYYCRKEPIRVELRAWSGTLELPEEGRPLYYLSSNSWGDRYGSVEGELRRRQAAMGLVYEGGRVRVYRVGPPP